MNNRSATCRVRARRRPGSFVLMLAGLAMLHVPAVSQPYTNPAAVNLATAGSFRSLAGVSVTVGTGTIVTGDVGVSPGVTITNNGTITGAQHVNDVAASQAQVDLTSAYNDAAARAIDETVPTELGGTALGRGVYTAASGTFSITGTLTLSGTASDVFIFRMANSLTAGVGSSVTLAGGAVASNVFWVVGSSATVDGDFKGVILAFTSITQTAGPSVLDGRTLARNGSVTVGGASVLPVQYTAFSVQGDTRGVDLRWSTATEVDNAGFEVERRAVANVGLPVAPFRAVGFVSGAGTSTSTRDYRYRDANVAPGRYAYRIRQIDRDGSSVTFREAEAEVGLVDKRVALEPNVPNPFNPSTSMAFRIGVDGMTTLAVYDLLGKHVTTLFDGEAVAGRQYVVAFDASGLPSGLYVARLTSGTEQVTQRMILMK